MGNMVILTDGRVGRDPEMRFTANGLAVTTFSLATTKFKKNDKNETEREPVWHRIVVFGKQAETAAKIISKGFMVNVVGEISYRKYKDRNETEKMVTEIVARSFETYDLKKDRVQEQSAADNGSIAEEDYTWLDSTPF